MTRAQLGFRRTPGAAYDVDFEGKKSGPAPRRWLQSSSLDIPEQECVPSETAKYNELFANPAAGVDEPAR